MELRELILAAFGPFTNQALAFQGAGGLHIVYGPNEAGKSSALRGLKALLYGIPDRTADNFIHPNHAMRVRGTVRSVNGQELGFVRRKGRKNTLSTLDDQPLDETALAQFLRGVTAPLFDSLFGIDYHALVSGGQEILDQKGDIGQALYSAALGSKTLRSVLTQLDQEADALFRPQGSKQKINAALKQYATLKLEIKNKSLSSQYWRERDGALAQTREELRCRQQEIAQARTELSRLERAQRILPKLAHRRELLQKLSELGSVIVLLDDFTSRRQDAERKLETAQEMARETRSRVDELLSQLADLTVHGEVLEAGENIEALYARLGAHRKAMQDRPALDAEDKQIRADTESLLKEVRPDVPMRDVETLRPVLAGRQRIIGLGNQFEYLSSRVKQTEKDAREMEADLKQALTRRSQLQDVTSPDALRRETVAARKVGDLDGAIHTERLELETLEAQCKDDLARLTLWRGPLQDITSLPMPMRESVEHFAERYEELRKRAEQLQAKRDRFDDALRETSRQLDEMHSTGTVPTEDDLEEARAVRDNAWNLLRRRWLDGEDVDLESSASQAGQPLPDAFEAYLAQADTLADRLRREADKVHKQASLMTERDHARRSATEFAHQVEECAGAKAAIDAEWAQLWTSSGFLPRSPREMREWLTRVESLREKVFRLSAFRQQADARALTRNTRIGALTQALRALGVDVPNLVTLDATLTHSDEVVARMEALMRDRETLDQTVETLERDLETARAAHDTASGELDAWRKRWKDSIAGLGLGDDASPVEASDMLEKFRNLFDKLNGGEKQKLRIQQIDQDAEAFRHEARRVVERTAPELLNINIEDAVARLNVLLAENRTRQTKRALIQEQVYQARRKIQSCDATIETMTARLDELCLEAKCEGHVALEIAERRSAEYLQLNQEIDDIEKDVLDAGEGATLTELETEAANADRDALRGQIQALKARIDEELEPARTSLASIKGGQETELALMNGGADAAVLAEQAQGVLAGIRAGAERYTLLKLAARVLRDEIERYRTENQGPLIKRSSEHFALLTCSSCQGLITDFNEKDEAVLAGVRPSGARVRVEEMSSGTRAQLYLALRLASLEKYMEAAEPMPFVVDDILVDFDDERSKAALEALARLAQKTQVILFTHHSRVLEQAQAQDGAVYVHRL